MKAIIEPKNIAVVLTGDEKGTDFNNIIKKVGWIELRIDIFLKKHRHTDLLKWIKKIRSITNSRIIATIRWHRESQNRIIIPESHRLQLYTSIIPFVDFVDVEIKSRIASSVVSEARKAGKKVILSYHNFHTTPSEKNLVYFCKQAQKLRADIVKIAVRIKEEKDLFVLITVLIKQKKKTPMVVIPMGSSFLQRLVPVAFGSQFTYAAFSNKTAPGQPKARELI